MVDFKDMSFTELVEVQKALNEEIEGRKLHKSDIYDANVNEKFAERWQKEGITDMFDISSNVARFNSSIYRICDFTLGNYKIENSKRHGELNKEHPKAISVNGQRIEIENPDIYWQMAKDLYDVVKKYL